MWLSFALVAQALRRLAPAISALLSEASATIVTEAGSVLTKE